MGSKSIIFIGVVISALYLYFSLFSYEPKTEEDVSTQTALVENEPIVSEENQSTQEIEIPILEERVASPAFGFMSGKKNQIVALMSDHDENGTLSQYIEQLCKNETCNQDLRFQNDIKDAAWQKGVSELIEILKDNQIENGSLFIESNVLKIEGLVKDYETKIAIDNILHILEPDLKIEQYITLSEAAQQAADEAASTSSTNMIATNTERMETNGTQEIENNETEHIALAEENQTLNEVKATVPKEMQKETKAKPPVAIKKETTPTPKKQTVSKTTPKTHKDIVAEPVMETTLDNDLVIRQESDNGANQPVSGIVADAVMQTTNDPQTITSRSAAQEKITNLVIVKPIRFEENGQSITQESKQTLNAIIEISNSVNTNEIIVGAYTVSDGDTVFDRVLSQKMADNVLQYLKTKGIRAKVVRSKGYGSEMKKVQADQQYSIEIKIIK